MARISFACLALLVLGVLPGGAAQTAQSNEIRVLDALGDVTADTTAGQIPAFAADEFDIRQAWIRERDESWLEIGVTTVAWNRVPTSSVWGFGGKQVWADFTHGDTAYHLVYNPLQDCEGKPVVVYTMPLAELNGVDWTSARCADAVSQPDAATVIMSLAKTDVVDSSGAPARYGTSVRGFHALVGRPSDAAPVDPEPRRMGDRAPDQGVAADLVLKLGRSAVGDVVLSSPQPVRISNGEATTFAFPLIVDNLGEAEATFALTTSIGDADWVA